MGRKCNNPFLGIIIYHCRISCRCLCFFWFSGFILLIVESICVFEIIFSCIWHKLLRFQILHIYLEVKNIIFYIRAFSIRNYLFDHKVSILPASVKNLHAYLCMMGNHPFYNLTPSLICNLAVSIWNRTGCCVIFLYSIAYAKPFFWVRRFLYGIIAACQYIFNEGSLPGF